jgi:hypothetical protein
MTAGGTRQARRPQARARAPSDGTVGLTVNTVGLGAASLAMSANDAGVWCGGGH